MLNTIEWDFGDPLADQQGQGTDGVVRVIDSLGDVAGSIIDRIQGRPPDWNAQQQRRRAGALDLGSLMPLILVAAVLWFLFRK